MYHIAGDRWLVPHDCLKFCLDFKVELMSDIIDVALCTELLSNTCKMTDHSLLTMKMVNSYNLKSDEVKSQTDDTEAECNRIHGVRNIG